VVPPATQSTRLMDVLGIKQSFMKSSMEYVIKLND
jgi:hypothetical protein